MSSFTCNLHGLINPISMSTFGMPSMGGYLNTHPISQGLFHWKDFCNGKISVISMFELYCIRIYQTFLRVEIKIVMG